MDLIIAMVGHVDETCIRKIYDATVPLIKVCLILFYKTGFPRVQNLEGVVAQWCNPLTLQPE